MSFFQNACKPEGLGGRLMLKKMNGGTHAKLAEYGFGFLNDIDNSATVLDAGCGGGANVAKWLVRCPEGFVCGLDYSDISVEETKRLNKAAIDQGRCEVLKGNVGALPYMDNTFDVITAFETIYFWPAIDETFRGINRILKTGGTFLICNESDGHDKSAEAFAKKIEGMTLYDADAITQHLLSAGFDDVQSYVESKKNWLVVKAKKM